MKTKQNSSIRASALQTTFSVTFISLSAALLALAAAPARHHVEQEPAGASMALQSAYRGAAGSEFSAVPKRIGARKSASIKFSATRQHVAGGEVAGFSARQERRAPEQNLTPPIGLKPVEQEAWLAMAQRQAAGGQTEFSSFYPARFGEPFVVEGQGVRVAMRPVGGTDSAAQISDSQVIYPEAYPETDSVHVVNSRRSEEFLFLHDECAPREFGYELSELSAGTRVELVKGEVRFTNKSGQGVKIESPWLIEANGMRRADAVHWELDAARPGPALQRLRLVVAKGLRYPVMIDPSWTETGSMGTARYSHTATLLASGQVLVAGGVDDTPVVVSSAELYDPATGTWTATGSMGFAREAHTATLLPSGQVLVAAGYGTAPLSSAELYDPVTGTWTATGSLAHARFGYTATLLPNGQVLVAGGNDSVSGFHEISSVELYDPGTETWRETGSLAHARQSHTATLLRNGQVLVAGGYNGTSLSSAELYDPRTRSWTATGSMGTSRNVPTATLLPNGQVLLAGGYSYTSGFLRSAELYDPATGTWGATGSMGIARAGHTATLVPSMKVLVAGGRYQNFTDTPRAELYDPVSGTWRMTHPLQIARQDHTATLLPSVGVMVAGGQNPGEGSNNQILSEAELYGQP